MDEKAQSKTFGARWWPLHIAIAWIMTRDRTFVERQWRIGGISTLAVSVAAAFDQVERGKIPVQPITPEEAWAELCDVLADGKVKIVATPFQRIAHGSGQAIETSYDQKEIPAAEVGSLELHQDGDELCLIARDWRVARGSNWNNLRGYRNVRVRPNGVIHYFPIRPNFALPSEALGPPMNPTEPGFMPLSQAAYWIASKGGTEPFDFREQPRWEFAFKQLMARISSGEVAVIGRRHGAGLPIAVDVASFAAIAVDYPYSESPMELVCCERPHVQSCGVIDSDDWEHGANDKLYGDDRRRPEFTHLQVRNADIVRLWNFARSVEIRVAKATDRSPPMHARIRDVVQRLWPDGTMPPRVKDRDNRIRDHFKAEFGNSPSARTIRRALNRPN